MQIRGNAVAALIAAAVAISCGDDPTCRLEDGTGQALACIDYADPVSESAAKASCESNGGIWQDQSCDENAVAKCDLFGSITWYYDAFVIGIGGDLEGLRSMCEQTGGTFTVL